MSTNVALGQAVVACPEQDTAAIVLLKALAKHGVRVAFGIPGGTISPLFSALAAVPEIRLISMRHEAMAAFAALGHARATGVPAIVLTTSGPGMINALTGIAAAFEEELPLILISGEVSGRAAGRGALQDGTSVGLDVHAMFRTITRWSGSLLAPEGAQGIAERAWQVTTSVPPGPVLITAAIDVAASPSPSLVNIAPARQSLCIPDYKACRGAARLLAAARRPLLVLGNGARAAASEARQLAERLVCPVVTTAHAKGVFPETHPLYLGLIGAGQHPSALAYVEEKPDVVCIVGSQLGDIATNGWTLTLAGTRATIQIDRDPWLIGRNAPTNLGIVGDAALGLQAMLNVLPSAPARPRPVPGGCRSLNEELSASDAVPLKPQRVLAALCELFPDAVWCCDIGEHLTMALHYLRVDSGANFHAMVGLGSMGSGIGAAIGMKEARPTETVIALCGDGGLAMFAGDLMTCVDNNINVIFAVFNDGCWNMVDHGFRTVHGHVPQGFPSRVADLATVARGFGATAVRISTPEGLAVLRGYTDTKRPLVLDIQNRSEGIGQSRHSSRVDAAFRSPRRLAESPKARPMNRDPVLENVRLALASGADPAMLLTVALASLAPRTIEEAFAQLETRKADILALTLAGPGDQERRPAELEPELTPDVELGRMRPDIADHEIRGKLLFGELLGKKSFFQVAAFAIAGIELKEEEAEVLEQTGVLTQLHDPHIWGLAVARRIGASTQNLANALIAGLACVCTKRMTGPPVGAFMRFLDHTEEQLRGGKSLHDVLDGVRARKEKVPGIGRPVVGPDERVPHIKKLSERYRLDTGKSYRLALDIDAYFALHGGARINSAGLHGAVLRDLGFSPSAASAFSMIYFIVPVLANAIYMERAG